VVENLSCLAKFSSSDGALQSGVRISLHLRREVAIKKSPCLAKSLSGYRAFTR